MISVILFTLSLISFTESPNDLIAIPKKIEMNAGIQIIDIGIKNLKLLSNVREIDIQYKLQIKYPNPKNHP